MKKLMLWLVAIGMALATQAPAAQQRASGDVVAENVGVTLQFSASGTPTDAVGTVSYSWAEGLVFTGTVNCFAPSGNNAGFSGPVETGPYTGYYFFIEVIDNGEGSNENPDAFRVLLFPDRYDCTQRTNYYPGIVSTGNINVR